MRFNVELTDNFKKEAKKLVKKYPSLKTELSQLFSELEQKPTMGTHLGNNIYKIRLSVASKNKGKSGGARVLSFVKVTKSNVLLFSIYSKGTVGNISDSDIKKLINAYWNAE